MAWEWIVLSVITLVGPVVFYAWMPARMEVTFTNDLTYVIQFSLPLRILRTALKFGFMWGVALALAQLERRLWLQVWVIAPALIGLTVHFTFVRKRRVHWRTGLPQH